MEPRPVRTGVLSIVKSRSRLTHPATQRLGTRTAGSRQSPGHAVRGRPVNGVRIESAAPARVLSVGGPWDSGEAALEVPGGTQRSFRWTPRWAATSAPRFCPLAAGG
jgi:hypothetical protein